MLRPTGPVQSQRAGCAREPAPPRSIETAYPAILIELVRVEERRGCNWAGNELGEGQSRCIV